MTSGPLRIDDPLFWRERLDLAEREREPHKAVWYTSKTEWDRMTAEHRKVLRHLLGEERNRPLRLLDCGCGIGSLVEILPPGVQYTGVDLSRDLVVKAKELYPPYAKSFRVADLRDLPFSDDEFDVAVVRSVEGMVVTALGADEWRRMEREILRVAPKMVLMGYLNPSTAKVVLRDSPSESDSTTQRIVHEHGSLVYRVGQNMTTEIYDIVVDEDHRRRGIGRRMIERLQGQQQWSLYAFTRETNVEAVRFYEALGFQKTFVPSFYPGMGAFILVWTNPKGIASINPLI